MLLLDLVVVFRRRYGGPRRIIGEQPNEADIIVLSQVELFGLPLYLTEIIIDLVGPSRPCLVDRFERCTE